MRKVKAVLAMSDLHLGRDLGYLYSQDPRYQSNRRAFLELLTELGPQDELVLNGDLLELSQAGLDQVYGELKEFFALLSQSPGFKRIVYVPGNHDHHFWRELAEHVCVNGQIANGMFPPSNLDYPSFFVDKHFSSADPNLPSRIVLSELWPKDKPAVEIVVKYPHHLINVLTHGGKSRNYVFTHGHFLEDLFTPINYLIEPARLDELEAFNNMWIEAIDYDFGRSGRLMEQVQDLVKKVEEGNKEAKREIRRVLAEIYVNCARKLKLNWLKRAGLWLIKVIATSFVSNLPLERKSGLLSVSIDEKLKARIVEYITKYILQRYRKGKAVEYNFPSDQDIPLPFTFVFGHTHRPAADEDQAFVGIDEAIYPLANTGGWLRTDGTGAANGENAGILEIDEMGTHWKSLKGDLQ
jgi:UDP-2,3-diacylglucosamine pyrophosphatase LpxH